MEPDRSEPTPPSAVPDIPCDGRILSDQFECGSQGSGAGLSAGSADGATGTSLGQLTSTAIATICTANDAMQV